MMHTLGFVITALLLINHCRAQDDTTSPEYIAKSAAEKSSIIMANIMEAKMSKKQVSAFKNYPIIGLNRNMFQCSFLEKGHHR